MSDIKLIVNPTAGAGRTAKKWPLIKSYLENIGLRFEYSLTEAPRHAIELAKSAAEKGYRVVVSVGGDGTINEVVNGLYEAGIITGVALGIISTGTGSDYIRTIGIPRDYKEAGQRLLNPKKLPVDLGVAEYTTGDHKERRLFINFAGLGFGAEVVRATTEKFKALGAIPSYLMGFLATFWSYENKEISLKLDEEPGERRVCTVIMSHGKYGGGSMLIAPDADPQDGLLDVLVVGNVSKLRLLWSLPRIYKGTHLTIPQVSMYRAKNIEVLCQERMSLEADGELLGETPARFYVLPAALNVIV